jgi:flagellin-specific chaperone FliS
MCSYITYYQEKPTDFPQVIDQLYDFMLYRVHLAMSDIRIHNVSNFRAQLKLTLRFVILYDTWYTLIYLSLSLIGGVFVVFF